MKNSILKSFLGVLLVIILFGACKNDQTTTTKTTTEPTVKKQVKIPPFDSEAAYQFIEKQVAFGPRVPNSDGHAACKDWLVSTLKESADNVVEQGFVGKGYDGKELRGTNIIAQFNPQAAKRILLAAHWDTRHIADSPLSRKRRKEPILGADDGGSGVGVLLEVAKNLKANPVGIGVDIILFDVEDYGSEHGIDDKKEYLNENNYVSSYCIGSQHWAKNPHTANYNAKFGILLDMVGAKGARFPKEEVSLKYAKPIVDKVWQLAANMGYSNFFQNITTDGVTDDHLMVNYFAKIPMIDIINLPEIDDNAEARFGPHWHTHEDNMDIIDKRTLRVVGQVVLAVIYREDGGTF